MENWNNSILESDFKVFRKKRLEFKVSNNTTAVVPKPELSVKNILNFYLNNSTIHGTNYLVDPNCNCFIRCIWGILILMGLSGIYYTCSTLQNSYQTNVIKNIMETGMMYPDTLPFPGVVVCNNHFINWDKIKMAEDIFLPKNSTNTLKELFRDFISGFEIDYFIELKSASRFTEDDLKQLDFLNTTKVLEFLSFEINQVIGRCRWKNAEMNCSQIFFKQKTQMGFCFIFNSIINPIFKQEIQKIEPDIPYPWTSSSSGRRSGLRIELIPHLSQNVPKHLKKHNSFFVRAIDSDDWPARRGDHIRWGTLNYFIIDQVDIKAESAIKGLPVIKRNCLFNDEVIKNKDYIDFDSHYAICRINCRLKQIMKYCKCVPDHLIPKTRFKPCTATGYFCIAEKHYLISNYSFTIKDKTIINVDGQCNCLTSCSIILIDTDVVTKRNELSNKTVIDFHYRKVATPKFQTLLSFSWADYMVYFGGISSTFVGTSIMSIWEGIFYIFMIISAILYKICKKFSLW